MPGEKAMLRQQLLAQRQSLSELWHVQQSQQICQHLVDFLEDNVANDQVVLSYWPYRQEPDLSMLLRLRQYQWGLPRCLLDCAAGNSGDRAAGNSGDRAAGNSGDRQLVWHGWQWDDLLVTNRYGLAEPAATAPIIDVAQVGVLLLPAVAVDRRGYRLGYGGGYFDRLLSIAPWRQVLTIGVVFDFAYLPTLPVDDWDQPLAAICTESGVVGFPKIAPV
jgi:5-formyltetrahydrofolate cyclo-ligase